jgi:putative hemolysin
MKIKRKEGLKIARIEHNKKLPWVIGFLIIVLVIIVISLRQQISERNNLNNLNNTQIVNPASVFCIENGGKLEIKDEAEGQVGMCTLKSGLVCEEWALFRGECGALRDSCLQNLDCVPASCCHPTTCVNSENAPNCSGMKCTMSCELGTLDCGQGSCICENSKCSVKLNS